MRREVWQITVTQGKDCLLLYYDTVVLGLHFPRPISLIPIPLYILSTKPSVTAVRVNGESDLTYTRDYNKATDRSTRHSRPTHTARRIRIVRSRLSICCAISANFQIHRAWAHLPYLLKRIIKDTRQPVQIPSTNLMQPCISIPGLPAPYAMLFGMIPNPLFPSSCT